MPHAPCPCPCPPCPCSLGGLAECSQKKKAREKREKTGLTQDPTGWGPQYSRGPPTHRLALLTGAVHKVEEACGDGRPVDRFSWVRRPHGSHRQTGIYGSRFYVYSTCSLAWTEGPPGHRATVLRSRLSIGPAYVVSFGRPALRPTLSCFPRNSLAFSLSSSCCPDQQTNHSILRSCCLDRLETNRVLWSVPSFWSYRLVGILLLCYKPPPLPSSPPPPPPPSYHLLLTTLCY